MNKKEVAEIKKLMKSASKCALNRVLVAYVDRDKNVVFQKVMQALNMPENELDTYMLYLRTALSGSIGKNLLELSYDTSSETTGNGFLNNVRNDGFKNEELTEDFVQRVSQNYTSDTGYYMIAMHCAYDVPQKRSDEEEADSEEVFTFVVTAICPVLLEAPVLCYNHDKNCMEMSSESVISVRKPVTGFLYPTFNDRATDVHNVLFYTSTPKAPSDTFINDVLGCSLELSPEEEKERFNNVLSRVLGPDATYNTTTAIHTKINENILANTNESVPLELNATEIKKILKDSGVDDEALEEFDDIYEEEVGDKVSLTAVNITNESVMKVTSPEITINVKPTATDKVSAKLVDGRRCLVIEMADNVEVNGLDVTVR